MKVSILIFFLILANSAFALTIEPGTIIQTNGSSGYYVVGQTLSNIDNLTITSDSITFSFSSPTSIKGFFSDCTEDCTLPPTDTVQSIVLESQSTGSGSSVEPTTLFDIRNISIDVGRNSIATSFNVENRMIELPQDIIIQHKITSGNMTVGGLKETREMNSTISIITTNITATKVLSDGVYKYDVNVSLLKNPSIYAIGSVDFKIEEGNVIILYPADYTLYIIIIIVIVSISAYLIYRHRKKKLIYQTPQ